LIKRGITARKIVIHVNSLDSGPALYNYVVMQLSGYRQPPPSSLDATFAALADPTRRAILARLAQGEASVNQLAEPFDISQPAISKHLKVLERAGLISRGRDAQRRLSRLEPQPLAEANQFLEQYREFWQTSFARLDTLLEEIQCSTPNPSPSRRRRSAKS